MPDRTTDSQYSKQQPLVYAAQLQHNGAPGSLLGVVFFTRAILCEHQTKARAFASHGAAGHAAALMLCPVRRDPQLEVVCKQLLETDLRDRFLWSLRLVVAAVLWHPLHMVAAHSGV